MLMPIERKVTSAAVSAAGVTLLVYLAGLAGVQVPSEVAAAAVTLVAAVAGWLAPHTPRPDAEH